MRIGEGPSRRWAVFQARAAAAGMALLVFLFVTPLIAGLGSTLDFCVELVWTDFVHSNPNRPISNVIVMLGISPLYGFSVALYLAGFPMLVGAVLSAVIVLLLGRLSATSSTLIAVFCAVIFVRGCYVGAEWTATDEDWRQTSPPWSTLIGGVALLTASLFCGRWAFERSGFDVSMTAL